VGSKHNQNHNSKVSFATKTTGRPNIENFNPPIHAGFFVGFFNFIGNATLKIPVFFQFILIALSKKASLPLISTKPLLFKLIKKTMKKIVLSIFALLSLPFISANAQVNVTFQVNITDYLAGGGVINNIVSIAGNFTSKGGSLPDWTPSQGAMTDMGNNMWSKSVVFDGTATDSLNWKYVSGSDWADGDEGNEWAPADASCTRPSDNNNRKMIVPTSGDFIVSSDWAKCHTVVTSILERKFRGLLVTLSPNPASTNLNINFNGTTNAEVKLTDSMGRIVKSFTGQELSENLNVSDLPAGIYYVTVVDGDKGFKAPVVITK